MVISITIPNIVFFMTVVAAASSLAFIMTRRR